MERTHTKYAKLRQEVIKIIALTHVCTQCLFHKQARYSTFWALLENSNFSVLLRLFLNSTRKSNVSSFLSQFVELCMSASLTKSFSMPIFVKAWEPKLIASILGSLFSSLVTSIFLWFFVLFPHFDTMTHSFFREMKITQSQRMKVAWRKLCHFFSETLFSISD